MKSKAKSWRKKRAIHSVFDFSENRSIERISKTAFEKIVFIYH